jgi:hypothetical protein
MEYDDDDKCHQEDATKVLVIVILRPASWWGNYSDMFPVQRPTTVNYLPPFFKLAATLVHSSFEFGHWKNHH